MTTAVAALPRYTPEELLQFEDEGVGYELSDRGELEERPMSVLSSWVAHRLGRLMGNHAEAEGLGDVFGADIGLKLWPDRPRRFVRPDVAFFAAGRATPDASGYLTIAPDLVAEVVSPNDGAEELQRKLREYLEAGVRLCWVVYPEERAVVVHRPDGRDSTLGSLATLTGEDVLPGFAVRVEDLFPPAQ